MHLGNSKPSGNVGLRNAPVEAQIYYRPLALVEALKIEPTNPDLKYNLASHYYFMGAWEEVIDMLDGSIDDRSVTLRDRAVSASRRRIECAGCGREWWAPRDIATQPVEKIEMAEDEETDGYNNVFLAAANGAQTGAAARLPPC